MQLDPTISVAVCTRNRPAQLRTCLQSLVSIRDRLLEVIVVDNASNGGATRELAAAFGARYVLEPEIGLTSARNRAVSVARGVILAFIDDDCQVDSHWADAIAEGFADPLVGCLTGPAISTDEVNWVQKQFESFSRAWCGIDPVETTASRVNGIYYRAVLGVGANMAYRLSVLHHLGKFRVQTGEDDYMQYKVVQAGYKVKYMPRAVVYEAHRATLAGTIVRLVQYGVGSMRVIWQLSSEERSFLAFLRNTAWFYLSGLRRLLVSAWQGRGWHLIFNLLDLTGVTAGLFLISGWSAHLRGNTPSGHSPANL